MPSFLNIPNAIYYIQPLFRSYMNNNIIISRFLPNKNILFVEYDPCECMCLLCMPWRSLAFNKQKKKKKSSKVIVESK